MEPISLPTLGKPLISIGRALAPLVKQLRAERQAGVDSAHVKADLLDAALEKTLNRLLPHLGGPIPMLMNRLDKQGQGPRGHPNLAEAPSVTARRFYYDTVCYGSKPAFLCALEAFGADHIVTGSDYPVLQDWEVYRETFAYIERLGLPKEVTDEILHHNAQKLFGFDH